MIANEAKRALPRRIELVPMPRPWLNGMATKYHYMHRPIHPLAAPFGWGIRFDDDLHHGDGSPHGLIVFASIHYTKLQGEFGYEGLPTKWQVLSLARLWLHDDLPRNSETVVIGKALKLVQRRWLEVHPPRFPDEPYHIRKVVSYADTAHHTGTIYRAANFREYGRTKSQARHKTRGTGSGSELICFIYDLPEPRWMWEFPQGHQQLSLSFAGGGRRLKNVRALLSHERLGEFNKRRMVCIKR